MQVNCQFLKIVGSSKIKYKNRINVVACVLILLGSILLTVMLYGIGEPPNFLKKRQFTVIACICQATKARTGCSGDISQQTPFLKYLRRKHS